MKRIHVLRGQEPDGRLRAYCGRTFHGVMLGSRYLAALPPARGGCRPCAAGHGRAMDAAYPFRFGRNRRKRPAFDGREIGRAVLGGEQ